MTQEQFPSEIILKFSITPHQVDILQEALKLLIEQKEQEIEQKKRERDDAQYLSSYIALLFAETTSDQASQIDEETIRKRFPESHDAMYWEVILKSLKQGCSSEQIVTEVLEVKGLSKPIGIAYCRLLAKKFPS